MSLAFTSFGLLADMLVSQEDIIVMMRAARELRSRSLRPLATLLHFARLGKPSEGHLR